MADQLSFDWPQRIALGPDDFFVSDANAKAHALVRAPSSWPEGKLAVTGPEGCGKTHLARLFEQLAGAQVIAARDLGPRTMPPDRPVVVEDMERLPEAGEEPLFHLHNGLRAAGLPLLLTSDRPPSRWPIRLPDLASRMQGTMCVSISDPDDRLLSAVILKLFQDRQLSPAPNVATYLASRIDRSFAAAARIVDLIDRRALATGRDINRKLASEILTETGPERPYRE